MGFFSSDWAQIFRIGVSRPGDSENALRSADFFSIFFVFGFFLTNNLTLNSKMNPNINPITTGINIELPEKGCSWPSRCSARERRGISARDRRAQDGQLLPELLAEPVIIRVNMSG